MDIYQDWIKQLPLNIDTLLVQKAPPECDKKVIEHRLGVHATIYFKAFEPDNASIEQLVKVALELHHKFDDLTGNKLVKWVDGRNWVHKNLSRADVEKLAYKQMGKGFFMFERCSADKGVQSSPEFLFTFLVRRIGNLTNPYTENTLPENERWRYSYLSVQVPYSWWSENSEVFRQWWNSVLTQIPADQAYLGLGYRKPLALDDHYYHESINYLLAQHFYGYDVDKPFRMGWSKLDGPYLGHGLRTPTYGILVQGKWLDKIGGKSVIESQIMGKPAYQVTPIGNNGYWIEVGDKPELYPVEQGIPKDLQYLYYILKPAILDTLWLLNSFYSSDAVKIPSRFHLDSSSAWLKRFEKDSEWLKYLTQ